MENINPKKKVRARGLKIFYAALALCLCVAGAFSYRALRGPSRNRGSAQRPQSTEPGTGAGEKDGSRDRGWNENQGGEPVPLNDVVPNVPDTRPAEPETQEPEHVEAAAPARPQIERAASFAPPMETQIRKGFSGGELVRSKTMGDWRTHNGTDFKGALGDSVKAINNGLVRAVYDDALWGTVVEIDHGGGLIAKYCGLGRGSTVSEGDAVQINDRVGNLSVIPAEAADDIHLHLELRQDGELIDPMSVIG